MSTAAYFDFSGPPDSREGTNLFQSLAIQTENCGRPQSILPLRVKPILNLINDFVKLAKTILCFLFSLFGRVSYKLNFKGAAVSLLV